MKNSLRAFLMADGVPGDMGAFKPLGRALRLYDSGGGGQQQQQPTNQTVTNVTVPEYAQPYAESMLGKAATLTDTNTNPYQPYQGQMVAGQTGLQQQANTTLGGMAPSADTSIAMGNTYLLAGNAANAGNGYTPFNAQSNYANPQFNSMGVGALGTRSNYDAAGFNSMGIGSRDTQSNYNAAGFNSMGIGSRDTQSNYNAADFSNMGIGSQQVGYNGPQFQNMGLGAGMTNTQAYNDPATAASYMNPYMRNVVDYQSQEAIRNYQKTLPQEQAAAVQKGAFGGNRQAINQSEMQRNLNTQLAGIAATGASNAYQQGAQQFTSDQGRSLASQQGNQQAMLAAQGQGLQQNLAGNQQNFQNAQLGLQANLANQQAGLTAQGQGLQQSLAANQYGLSRAQTAGQFDMQSQLANQQAGLTAQGQGLQQNLAANQYGLTNAQNAGQFDMQSQLANQQAGLTAQGQGLQQNLAANQYGLTNAQNAGQFDMQSQLANQQAGLTAQGQGLQQNLAGNQYGLTSALNAGQLDLQSQQSNQQAGLTAQGQGLQQNLAANQQNVTNAQNASNYGLQAQQLNAQQRQYQAGLGLQGLQTALSGQAQIGNLANQNYNQQLGIADAQMRAGTQQQTTNQSQLNTQYQQYADQLNHPYKQLSFMQGIVQGLPMSQTASSMYQAPPSGASSLASLGLGAYGLSGLLGKKKGGVVKMADGGLTHGDLEGIARLEARRGANGEIGPSMESTGDGAGGYAIVDPKDYVRRSDGSYVHKSIAPRASQADVRKAEPKKMAGGGLTNQMQLLSTANNLPDEALAKSGAVPPYMKQGIMQQRGMLRTAMPGQPQTPGVEGLPAPNMEFADGGIVGYSGTKAGSLVGAGGSEMDVYELGGRPEDGPRYVRRIHRPFEPYVAKRVEERAVEGSDPRFTPNAWGQLSGYVPPPRQQSTESSTMSALRQMQKNAQAFSTPYGASSTSSAAQNDGWTTNAAGEPVRMSDALKQIPPLAEPPLPPVAAAAQTGAGGAQPSAPARGAGISALKAPTLETYDPQAPEGVDAIAAKYRKMLRDEEANNPAYADLDKMKAKAEAREGKAKEFEETTPYMMALRAAAELAKPGRGTFAAAGAAFGASGEEYSAREKSLDSMRDKADEMGLKALMAKDALHKGDADAARHILQTAETSRTKYDDQRGRAVEHRNTNATQMYGYNKQAETSMGVAALNNQARNAAVTGYEKTQAQLSKVMADIGKEATANAKLSLGTTFESMDKANRDAAIAAEYSKLLAKRGDEIAGLRARLHLTAQAAAPDTGWATAPAGAPVR